MLQFCWMNIWHPHGPARKKRADYRLAADAKYLDITSISFVQQNRVYFEMRKNLTFLVLDESQEVFQTYQEQNCPRSIR